MYGTLGNSMPYSASSIANYFIDKANSAGEKLTPMKLQKLVYYAMGWYAGYTGKPLIDEAVEAWQYGPVFPSLYQEFRRFGAGAVAARATEFNDDFEVVEVPTPDDASVRSFLDNVWNSYSRYPAIKLSEMTHASGSPWDITWQGAQGVRNKDIPFELIEHHFAQAVEKAKAGRAS